MDNERTAVITIGDEEYTLLLTTKATKEIAGRYGGLENLGEINNPGHQQNIIEQAYFSLRQPVAGNKQDHRQQR